jgi:ribonuclease Z
MMTRTLAVAMTCFMAATLPSAIKAQTEPAPADGRMESEPAIKVTLLGTASPAPRPDRMGISTLVEAGGQRLVFDAGRGVPVRLWQLGIPIGSIDTLFITHFHSDHVSGIPDVWLTGWLGAPYGRRTSAFHVVGPTGTASMMQNIEEAYAADIAIRIEDEKLTSEGIAVNVEEFETEGPVYEKDGVTVTAIEVNHGDAIKPNYGYRVDYDGHSVVLSGDTKFDENLIEQARGTDLLIHEVAMARPEWASEPGPARVLAHHVSPSEAGEVFTQVEPKLAVYSHIVLLSGPEIPEPTLDELVAETQTTYSGPFEVGEDLMSFSIGDTVEMTRFEQ